MKPPVLNLRLFAETLAIIASAEVAIMFLLPGILPDGSAASGMAGAMLDAALLTLVAAPLILWRINAALNRAENRPAESDAPSAKPMGLAVGAALIVLVAGLTCSLFAAWGVHEQTHALAQSRFDHLAERIEGEFQRRLQSPLYGLRGLRGPFVVSEKIGRSEFRDYAASRDLANEFPGAMGLGYVERVPRVELDAYVAAVRAAEGPEFTVSTSGDLPDVYVTRFIEPLEKNRAVWGWDIATDPIRREAADRAMLTGEAAFSGMVLRNGDVQNKPGIRCYLPVYRKGTHPATPEERRRDLRGWVYMPLVVEKIMAGLGDAAGGQVDCDLYDGRAPTLASLMYCADGEPHSASDAAPGTGEVSLMFHKRSVITVGGREWTLCLANTPAFDTAFARKMPALAGTGGVLISILLALVVWGLGLGRARALAALAKLAAYRSALDVQTIIAITDCAGRITEVNEPFCRISGYSREKLIGCDHRMLNSGIHRKAFWEEMWNTIALGDVWKGEVCNKAKDGTLYWVDTAIGPVRDAAGKICGNISVCIDITDRKRAEDELRSAAYMDKLTGLPNRALLRDRLEQALLRSRRRKDAGFAVLFLDFDRFKLINDTLGHDAGDQMLREIAARLCSALRSGDSVSSPPAEQTTARLGGDEFVVLLDGIAGADDAVAVADRLVEVFSQPFCLGGHEVFSSVSIGIATGDEAIKDAEQVLRNADMAMYEAKLAGKGRHVRFEASMGERVRHRHALENDLRKALDAGQFFLMYQPIVALESGEVDGLEALVRWTHPQRGLVGPNEFIPIAEQTGLILPIGEWVLREACRQFVRWSKELGNAAPRSINVNLSRNQLSLKSLPATIRRILEETGVPASCLHLEITENAVMQDVASGTRMLNAIGEMGIKQCLDDFGTGQSSLACLHQLPINVLKIDRSFVANMEQGRDFVALVHATIQLANNLEISVVAEGIETVAQLATLQSMGCAQGQGYFFSKPLMVDDVAGFMRKGGVAAKSVKPLPSVSRRSTVPVR